MNFVAEIERAYAGRDDIPLADYLRWIHQGDLPTRARAYHLSASEWSRIKPEPGMDEQCAFMAEYLLECLVEDPASDGVVHGGYEAGWEMAAWLKHLSSIPEAHGVIVTAAGRLAETLRNSDAGTRNRIETGLLEHALESPHLRPFFEGWALDPVLRESYQPALKWGLAHSEDAG